MTNIIKNLETGKIELHFEKTAYMALTDSQKADLKSAYLWSNYGKCWVSRAKEPNTYHAERIAEKLGFSGIEKVGERLTYAEQLERKAERAEARADRYEEYSSNAEKRAETLQSDFNKYRQDIAWLTQPIIAGHSGSRAFANHRNKVMKRFERGMDEYRKSEYYQDRAATARSTANMAQLKDPVYLDNRIKECNKNLRAMQTSIVNAENTLYRINNGEALRSYNGDLITAERLEERISDLLDRYDAEQDKLNFMEDCMSELGGVKFSQENIKVGYIVEMQRWGKCEIVSAGPVNVQIKTGHSVLTEPYAAIVKIIAVKAKPVVVNPYAEGDILTLNRMGDGSIYRAFQVLKATEKSIQIQEITVEKGIPQAGQFRQNSKPERKGIVKSKFSDYVGAYYDGWQLYKYTEKETQTA